MSELPPKVEEDKSPPVNTIADIGETALHLNGFERPNEMTEFRSVQIGDTVVLDIDGVDESVVVLPSEQAQQSADAVSETSPMGRAIHGSVVSSVVRWRTPRGELIEATVKKIMS